MSVIMIDSENFPDENFRAIAKTLPGGDTGKFSEKDIQEIISINCPSIEIADLTGIEHFTFLRELSCSGNQLTSLDVSQNKALKYLYCSDNQLRSINVSGCTALHEIVCNGNRLTTLDISDCTALEILSCHSNQIHALDVSVCTNLFILDCHTNPMRTLNISRTQLSSKTFRAGEHYNMGTLVIRCQT